MRLASNVVMAVIVLATSAQADVLPVHPDGSGPYPTIQAAVDAAVSGDVIELQNGTFSGSGNRDVAIAGKELIIRSATDDPSTCTIDCDASVTEPHRAFEFTSAGFPYNGRISGVTIINGYADLGGAIVTRELAYVSVMSCVFRDNIAGLGGALCCIAEDVGDGGSGGGEYLYLLYNCLFENNRALGSGGAALLLSGSYLCESCIVRGNEGCGFFFQFARADLRRCRFFENTGSLGALVWDGCFHPCDITTSVFSENVPAALHCTQDCEPYIGNCTFWGNEIAVRDLGGTFYTIENTIITNSTTAAFSDGNRVLFACSDMCGNEGGDWIGPLADQLGRAGNICADPLFCDPQTGDFHLQANSPCAPFTPPNEECDLIGAWPVNCSSTPVETASWGRIKALFQ